VYPQISEAAKVIAVIFGFLPTTHGCLFAGAKVGKIIVVTKYIK
jgi:hypothetical protein